MLALVTPSRTALLRDVLYFGPHQFPDSCPPPVVEHVPAEYWTHLGGDVRMTDSERDRILAEIAENNR
jgi:hypothetical protein